MNFLYSELNEEFKSFLLKKYLKLENEKLDDISKKLAKELNFENKNSISELNEKSDDDDLDNQTLKKEAKQINVILKDSASPKTISKQNEDFSEINVQKFNHMLSESQIDQKEIIKNVKKPKSNSKSSKNVGTLNSTKENKSIIEESIFEKKLNKKVELEIHDIEESLVSNCFKSSPTNKRFTKDSQINEKEIGRIDNFNLEEPLTQKVSFIEDIEEIREKIESPKDVKLMKENLSEKNEELNELSEYQKTSQNFIEQISKNIESIKNYDNENKVENYEAIEYLNKEKIPLNSLKKESSPNLNWDDWDDEGEIVDPKSDSQNFKNLEEAKNFKVEKNAINYSNNKEGWDSWDSD